MSFVHFLFHFPIFAPFSFWIFVSAKYDESNTSKNTKGNKQLHNVLLKTYLFLRSSSVGLALLGTNFIVVFCFCRLRLSSSRNGFYFDYKYIFHKVMLLKQWNKLLAKIVYNAQTEYVHSN